MFYPHYPMFIVLYTLILVRFPLEKENFPSGRVFVKEIPQLVYNRKQYND